MSQPSANLIETLEIPVKDAAGLFRFVRIMENTGAPLDQPESAQPLKLVRTSVAPASMQERPINKVGAVARHYIDAEDELEVSKLAVPATVVSAELIEEAAASLVMTLDLKLQPEQKIKLSKIIFSLLKGIRNPRETREVLTREPSLGGLGLMEARASEVVSLAEAKKLEIFNRLKGDLLESAIHRPGAKDNQAVEDMYETEVGPRLGSLLTEVQNRSRNQAIDMSEQQASYTPTSKPMPVGPVEEMRLMSMEQFRHLGKTPAEAAQRIFQKIDLLADESLELKSQAIKAWKQSPVYQGYLSIGHQSLDSHTPVETLIKNKSVNDMTMDEFKVVADLNKSLQF